MAMVQSQVYTLISTLLCIDIDHIKADSHLRDDLNADSLDLVILITELADKFDVDICDTEVQNVQTAGEIVAYINQNRILSTPSVSDEVLQKKPTPSKSRVNPVVV